MQAAAGAWSVVNAEWETIAENLHCWEDAIDVAQKTFGAQKTDWRRPRSQSLAGFEFFDVRTDKVLGMAFFDYK